MESSDIGGAMVQRLGLLATTLALVATACSPTPATPSEFAAMTPDEVGRIVSFGDMEPFVMGPLGPSDSETVAPNDYTTFRIGRTASSVVVVVESPRRGSNASIGLNEIPSDGIVARGGFVDGGNPGYEVRCWRGDG